MLLAYISLIGGLAALVVAGDILVRGSVGIATRLGIPSLIIGLTIVAFGTSAPELVISLKSAMEGADGIAIGNVVGSNIANVLIVLGLPALIANTPCNEKGTLRNSAFMVAISLIFIGLCYQGTLSVFSGLILLVLLVVFLADSARTALAHRKSTRSEQSDDSELLGDIDPSELPDSYWKAGVMVAIGLIGLPISAHFTIDGATQIAAQWGVSDAVIGLTVVALGTSLPELATTMMAAIRGHAAVALGNVIGSNIFNILAILGITSVITPLDIPAQFFAFDFWVMLACALLVLFFTIKKIELNKVWGVGLTLAYVAYIYGVFAVGQAG
ncbi:calcium/sodium antiporter [Rhodobacteraceae bacterium RKSG542]|uniref:calcium/sodium antiporter n=1 Tax=Pseudovibrio flavus TaxID=2529854 RepID=UPI0012BB9B82|nr:calcium/sodium antiporter [Pseudovibrio flavus]MTI19044.1 calcium/sodium antiporter [Pseudovibrio flavus]